MGQGYPTLYQAEQPLKAVFSTYSVSLRYCLKKGFHSFKKKKHLLKTTAVDVCPHSLQSTF